MAESRLFQTDFKSERAETVEELQTKIKLEPEDYEDDTNPNADHSSPNDIELKTTRIQMECPLTNVTKSETSSPFHGMTIIKLEEAMDKPKNTDTTINKLLEKIYSKLDYTDMELVSETEECVEKSYPCHRAVLAAASPILDQLFKSQTQGRVFNVTSMMSSEITGDLLKYIYTGVTPESGGTRLDKLRWIAKVLKITLDSF